VASLVWFQLDLFAHSALGLSSESECRYKRLSDKFGVSSAKTPRPLSAAKSIGWIVGELLRVSPTLTDRKLLLHLSHEKLTGMLVDARKRAAAVRRSA
jgi:hypothetical protein